MYIQASIYIILKICLSLIGKIIKTLLDDQTYVKGGAVTFAANRFVGTAQHVASPTFSQSYTRLGGQVH